MLIWNIIKLSYITLLVNKIAIFYINKKLFLYLRFEKNNLSRITYWNTHHFIDSNLFRNSGASATLPEVCDGSSAEAVFRHLSDAEQILLESLDVDRYRSRHTGRFLTMHKRRRKKLTTRSLNQEPGILDDIFHGLVQVIYT